MKKILFYFSAFVIITLLFASCSSDEPDFDEGLLIGTWRSGTEYYKYLANYTGSTWDTSDDVSEDEALPFTWNLVKSELQQIHLIEMGGSIPIYYTVVELTSSSLKYKDTFNKTFSFTKVR